MKKIQHHCLSGNNSRCAGKQPGYWQWVSAAAAAQQQQQQQQQQAISGQAVGEIDVAQMRCWKNECTKTVEIFDRLGGPNKNENAIG